MPTSPSSCSSPVTPSTPPPPSHPPPKSPRPSASPPSSPPRRSSSHNPPTPSSSVTSSKASQHTPRRHDHDDRHHNHQHQHQHQHQHRHPHRHGLHNPLASPHHPALDHAYVLGSKLGRGCFATVYKATRRVDGHAVAIKVVDKQRLDAETATLLENELDILRVVSQHPGIVTLLDSVETPGHMYFVLDYVEGGQLLDRIVSRGSFSENDARILMRAILLTLQFLAQLGCVHRDIKPENILVDNYSRAWPVKLTDFGLSAKMQPNELLRDALGTPLFIAPEVLTGAGYDCSCDMWSLGVVLYIVLCGYPPFPYNEDPATLVRAIVNGQYSFPEHEWNHVSCRAKDLVRAMLEVDPQKRISPQDALKHPWIAVAQSTCDLPNRNLRSFNARRKLKASVVAVRTTFGFMKFVNSASRLCKRPAHHASKHKEDLMRDVERSRELIRSMGISESGKSIYNDFGTSSASPRSNNRNSISDDAHHLSHRRSLVLPTGALANVLSEVSDADEEEEESVLTRANEGYWLDPGRSFDLEAIPPNAMQSRAKAMVAEVKEDCGVGDEDSPFLVFSPGRAEDLSRRKPLEQLDFGILDL